MATLLWPAEKAKAKERTRGKGKKGVAKLPPQKSRAAAGKKAGVSGRYVSDAAKLKRDASLKVLSNRRSNNLSTHPFFWGAFIATGAWK